MKQSAKNILLIRPANFGFNPETTGSNAFQHETDFEEQKILSEFDDAAEKLKKAGVNVFVFDDTPEPLKPDAVFPNNWISFHADGKIVLYPMLAASRRAERRNDIVERLKERFKISGVLDLSRHEADGKFLEGTGSIVFDHENRRAYACLSPRTDKKLFVEVCEYLGSKPIYFRAVDENGKEIYHTNVMMCIGEKFAVICLESITDQSERELVTSSLTETGHQIIDISFEQMNKFAGNMLALQANDKNIVALSKSAFESLNATQKSELEKYCEPLPLSIETIETVGGGSARCMIAEIFLEPLE